jgi:hypothetical protein
MERNFPAEEEVDRVRQLSEQVLNDPAFLRAPVLARLLRYLIDKTASQETISSYSIAFEGLGKQGHDQADADTYARVAVARLRKTLAAYYATSKDTDQIYVISGTYQVRLRRDLAGNTETTDDARTIEAESSAADSAGLFARISRFRYRGWLLLVLTGLLLLTSALAMQGKFGRDSVKWKDVPLPSLGVMLGVGTKDAAIPLEQITAERLELIALLQQYNGFVVADRPPDETDFIIKLAVASREGALFQTVTLTESATGNVVWAKTFPLSDTSELTSVASSAVDSIASPNGALMGYLRRKGYDINTPTGCWLQFTEGVQTLNAGADAKLRECAAAWHENAPNSRHATFLYAWTLLGSATNRSFADDKAATLQQAHGVLRRAIMLYPDFALFHIAAMREYAQEGNRPMVLQSAADAIRTGKGNRFVVGLAASTLVSWNDPSGEKILMDLSRADGEAYPWEHVGLFVAAMMQDDTSAAGRHVIEIEELEDGQPLLLIIKAAYASRVGQRDKAGAALARLRANPLIRLAGINTLINSLPIAPEVAARLREWLPRDI